MQIARFSFLSALAAAVACGDSGLSRNAPRLDVTPYPIEACASDGINPPIYSCPDAAAADMVIDLGVVPVHATKWAVFKLDNPTGQKLSIYDIKYVDGAVTGDRWEAPEAQIDGRGIARKDGKLDFDVEPYKFALLRIGYSPRELSAPWTNGQCDSQAGICHRAVAVVMSDAANGAQHQVTVTGSSEFLGAPDLEVEYNSFRGPDAVNDCVDTDANGSIDGCRIPPANALNFGNIGLNSQGTARLIIRNTAQCTPYNGVDPCSLCSLTVKPDSTRQNIGLGLKAGTDPSCDNDVSFFSFAGSTATPFDIAQRDVTNCGESGEVRLLLNFAAPAQEGRHCATVVIESSDIDEPLLEIPITAYARNAPVAIGKFHCDINDPTRCTDPQDIEPLDRVYLNGQDSYDPAVCPTGPNDPNRSTDPTCGISAWQWDVLEYPPGSNPADFQFQGQATNLSSFYLPLAGHYVVRLTVWNSGGIQSGDTPQSRVEFDAVPGSAIHVQLVWDNNTNDQDLHLVNMDREPQGRVCNNPWDVHYLNRQPVWDTAFVAGDGPNPRLDVDDVNGLGPENINIDSPDVGRYRVYVHYYGDSNFGGNTPTRETIRIYLNGLQVVEYRRTLSQVKAVWAVAEINWTGGNGFVTPYPSDAPGETGSVRVMTSCSSPGWVF